MLNELYGSLYRRIMIFMNLPFEKLDRMAVRARLDEIGAGPVGALARTRRAEHARRHQWHGPDRPARAARRVRGDAPAGRRPARRQPARHRACQRDQGRRGGGRPPARIRQPARALAAEFRRRGRGRDRHRQSPDRVQRGEHAGRVPWGDLGCDIVLECTGKFLKPDQLQGYFERGVRRVIVAAPVKDPAALNVVVGVNDDRYDPAEHRLLTAASCTTNCLAPVVKIVHEALGIRHGQITTIHDPTNTNVVVDAPHRDLRRARSAMLSLQPTTTGSATAIALIYPELKGRLNGHAVRVPVLNASLTDCVFELERRTSESEVNELFRAAAAGPLAGISATRRDRWSRPTTTTTPAARSSTAPARW